jgi:hypothetical protein
MNYGLVPVLPVSDKYIYYFFQWLGRSEVR